MPTAPRSGHPFRSLFLPRSGSSVTERRRHHRDHPFDERHQQRQESCWLQTLTAVIPAVILQMAEAVSRWVVGCDGESLYVAVEVEGNRKMVPYVSTISTTYLREGGYSLLSLGRCKIYASQTILITL